MAQMTNQWIRGFDRIRRYALEDVDLSVKTIIADGKLHLEASRDDGAYQEICLTPADVWQILPQLLEFLKAQQNDSSGDA